MPGVPVHAPGSAVSVRPSRASPVMVGGTELTGGKAAITGVKALVARLVPPAFVAVTPTRIVEVTSSGVSAYVVVVAPAMSTHASPDVSQRRHWYSKPIGVEPVHAPAVAVSV